MHVYACTFVVGPRICVCPCDELLVYPREQADGRVGEAESERLRLSGLFDKVARAVFEEALGSSCRLSLARRERRDQTLEECYGAFTEVGRIASNFFVFFLRDDENRRRTVDVLLVWLT